LPRLFAALPLCGPRHASLKIAADRYL
jgi:hypothetical protein